MTIHVNIISAGHTLWDKTSISSDIDQVDEKGIQ